MTDVDKLLRQYIERFESEGDVDPSDLLSKLKGRDRAELSALIEGYLEHAAPAEEWDAEAFEGSLSERAVARLAETWSDASGQLPSDLVALRNAKKLKRGELVNKLADALGVSGKREKVALYYHQLEQGLLPAEQVSTQVFDSLAKLLGTTANALRQAGAAITQASSEEAQALHARTAPPPPEEFAVDEERVFEQARPDPTKDEWDEVDELFRGGG